MQWETVHELMTDNIYGGRVDNPCRPASDGAALEHVLHRQDGELQGAADARRVRHDEQKG